MSGNSTGVDETTNPLTHIHAFDRPLWLWIVAWAYASIGFYLGEWDMIATVVVISILAIIDSSRDCDADE